MLNEQLWNNQTNLEFFVLGALYVIVIWTVAEIAKWLGNKYKQAHSKSHLDTIELIKEDDEIRKESLGE